MIPEISFQGFLIGYLQMLGLIALFLIPYFIIIRKFYSEVSGYRQIIYAFVLSQGMKLLLFGISATTHVFLGYLFAIESISITIIAVFLVLREHKRINFIKGLSVGKLLFAIITILIIWGFLYRISDRYEWDAVEFYLPYAKLYVAENRLTGYSPEISNYLSLPFLQPIIFSWSFTFIGISDDSSLFVPLLNVVLLAIVTREIAIRFLKREFIWVATGLSIVNILLWRYLFSIPRYVDLPYAVLVLIFFLTMFNKNQETENKQYFISFLVFSEAIFTKINAFSLYLLVGLLFLPLFWRKLTNLVVIAIWGGALFFTQFVLPMTNIVMAREDILVLQAIVIVLLSIMTILHRKVLKFIEKKTFSFKPILFILLLSIPALVYFGYEWSIAGQPLFPFVKTSTMSPATNLLSSSSAAIGRIESYPLSIIYLVVSSVTGIFLPFFAVYMLFLGRNIFRRTISDKDKLVLQLLLFAIVLIIGDYAIFGSISPRRQITSFIVYQLICVAGFSLIVQDSSSKMKIGSFLYLIINLLYIGWRFGQIDLDTNYARLSFDLPLFVFNGIIFLIIYYMYSKSNHSSSESTQEDEKPLKIQLNFDRLIPSGQSKKVADKHSERNNILRISIKPSRLIFIASITWMCMIILIQFPAMQNYLDFYDWSKNKTQSQMISYFSNRSGAKILTFGLVGEYYHGDVYSVDLVYVESLSLIYPDYTKSVSGFINRLEELEVQYIVIPKDHWLAPWFKELVSRVPVFQLLYSDTLFPLIGQLDIGYDIRQFRKDILFDIPIMTNAFIRATESRQIDGENTFNRWISAGYSENLTVEISFIVPSRIQSVKSFYMEGSYVVGGHKENLSSNVSYKLTEKLEGLYTFSFTLTGNRTLEEFQIYNISMIKLDFEDENEKIYTLRLVSSYWNPLAIWYSPEKNEWSLQRDTFLLHPLKIPLLRSAFAEGEQAARIDGLLPIESWMSLGESEKLNFKLNFIAKDEIQTVTSLQVKGQTIYHGKINDTIFSPQYNLSKQSEGLFDLSFTLFPGNITGEYEYYVLKIFEIKIGLQDVKGNYFSIDLVSYERPLTFWYVINRNEWAVEKGTTPIHQVV